MAHIYLLPTFDVVLRWGGGFHYVLYLCSIWFLGLVVVVRTLLREYYWWGWRRRNPWIHSHGDIVRPNRYSSCSSLHTELKAYILWCSHDVGYSGAVGLYEPSELYYVVDISVKLTKSTNYHSSLALFIREVTFYNYKIELKFCSDSTVYRRYAVLQNLTFRSF